VQQEVTLASHTIILACGSNHILWEPFRKVMFALQRKPTPPPFNSVSDHGKFSKRIGLVLMLCRPKRVETFPSKIYAVHFGASLDRLSWSPAGSPLSRHYNKDNECIGCDPTADPQVRTMVERAKSDPFGREKIFTLVDTNTMTVTLFSAVRPPIAVLLCGREGGMLHAVMCSYDSSTQTLYREAVLRMETPILSRMARVARFRFGFRRPLPEVQPDNLQREWARSADPF
jgi:hypothetical protein